MSIESNFSKDTYTINQNGKQFFFSHSKSNLPEYSFHTHSLQSVLYLQVFVYQSFSYIVLDNRHVITNLISISIRILEYTRILTHDDVITLFRSVQITILSTTILTKFSEAILLTLGSSVEYN